MMAIDPEALAAWVRASCDAQGIGVYVSDASALDRVRAVVNGGRPGAGPHRGAHRPAALTPPTPAQSGWDRNGPAPSLA